MLLDKPSGEVPDAAKLPARPYCSDLGPTLQRFENTKSRGLALGTPTFDGASVLVTGGTGCVGTAALLQLLDSSARRIVSLSRGNTLPVHQFSGVEYRYADVRDDEATARIVAKVRPDIVIHLAAIRDPGRAERLPAEALSTNILGTANILKAASANGTQAVVIASTGKAVRYWTPDVYATSKMLAEFEVAKAVRTLGLRGSAVRFTHIVDNSIVHARFHTWADRGESLRLHGSDVAFYAQSAREAAQLILHRSLEVDEGPTIAAQCDLGWPIDLLDLAVEMIAAKRSASSVQVVGYEKGYEESSYPGTYDPATSGDHSPLINAIEATTAALHSSGQYEYVPIGHGPAVELEEKIKATCKMAEAGSPRAMLVAAVRNCGRLLLRWRLQDTPVEALRRVLAIEAGAAERAGAHRVIRSELCRYVRESCRQAA